MFKLKTGYFISGSIIGLMFLYSFITTFPDNKLHIIFCNVGQGDGAYIKFPDGRDMIVDGGPDTSLLKCLGNHMPFWDRTIDIVLLTHPQQDHMQGLLSVLERFRVKFVVRSDIQNNTDGYIKFLSLIKEKKIPQKLVSSGEHIAVGRTFLDVVWPSVDKLAAMKCSECNNNILGVVSNGDSNDGAVVFMLSYRTFNTFFSSDADTRVESAYTGSRLPDGTLEVLKVPHHGSKTGMDEAFVDWLKPKLSIISVGKNTYGHPTQEAIRLLEAIGSTVMRTDQSGDIEVISDGINWQVR